MIILREHIVGLTTDTNKKINNDVYIKNGVVYINNGEHKYKYENDCYFIEVGGEWLNMQGGVPVYELEENLDENIFIANEQGGGENALQ